MDTFITALTVSDGRPDAATATSHLRRCGFSEPEQAWSMVQTLGCRASGLYPSQDTLPPILTAVASSFDPERGLKNLYTLLTQSDDASAAALFRILTDRKEERKALVALCSGSPYLTATIMQNPPFIVSLLSGDAWRRLRERASMASSMNAVLNSMKTIEEAMVALRVFKRQEYLRIALCDLLKYAATPDVLKSLSDVADLCLQGAHDASARHLEQRHGIPMTRNAEGRETPCEFAIIGMGKLGGQELNFSSDIDLLYVYDVTDGITTKTRLSTYEYFPKLAQLITDVVGRITPNGFVFRVDLRLRPEGRAGDIANTAEGYRWHYQSFGQIWERQALIKARPVAGSQTVGQRFLETVRAFVFQAESDPLILDDINRMREKINRALLERSNGEYHVKLGPGGIRDIEFILQGFQLIYGGMQGWPWERNTLKTLDWIAARGYLSDSEAVDLRDAYLFLRDLENRIQMMNGQQTHEIPADEQTRATLARMMGIRARTPGETADLLRSHYHTHTHRVRRIYNRVFHSAMH